MIFQRERGRGAPAGGPTGVARVGQPGSRGRGDGLGFGSLKNLQEEDGTRQG